MCRYSAAGRILITMDPFFVWLESTALSQWVVSSPSLFAFPGILALHAIGMGVAVGLSIVIDLRILGVARGVPPAAFRRFMPVLWAGFWVNAVSGVLLLIAYPTKALTNPVFYLKLVLIAAAMVLLAGISRRALVGTVDDSNERGRSELRALRWRALASMACWIGAITAGRLLAYTYTRLMAG